MAGIRCLAANAAIIALRKSDVRCWSPPASTQQRLRRSHPGALALRPQHRNQCLDRLHGDGDRRGQQHGRLVGRPRGIALFARLRLHGLVNLLLDSFQVEARALLHRRKLNRSLSEFPNFLLHKNKTPEFVCKPVIVAYRTALNIHRNTGALIWVEPQIGQDRPIDLYRAAKPAIGLIRESVFVVADTRSGERALREVPNLIAL